MRQKFYLSAIVFERCGKIKTSNLEAQQSERISKRAFLKQILDSDIELIQLPCPDFSYMAVIAGGMLSLSSTLLFSVKRQNVCWNQFSCRLKNIFLPQNVLNS